MPVITERGMKNEYQNQPPIGPKHAHAEAHNPNFLLHDFV